MSKIIPNLEEDLKKSLRIKELVQNRDFAVGLYAALCNRKWLKDGEILPDNHWIDDCHWACSWRYAGELVADLRNQNEDYTDFYCSGGEGGVTLEVEIELKLMGWTSKDYD